MEPKEQHSIQVGEKAPGFIAASTRGEIRFPEDYQGKWVVLFNIKADFTPVSCTELLILGSMISELKEINTELIAISPDSLSSHIAWLRKIKELAWKDIKHIEITFPVIADPDMGIIHEMGMAGSVSGTNLTTDDILLVDPTGVIRAAVCYPTAVGRNFQEIKRLIQALQKVDREKIEIPAGWMPGEDVILSSPDTFDELAWRPDTEESNIYSLDWFLCFKQSDAGSSEKQPEINPYPSAYPLRRRPVNRR